MVKVLIPAGALGIGFDERALALGVAAKPDIIAIDGGSTDSGPSYLGTGTSKYARGTIKALKVAVLKSGQSPAQIAKAYAAEHVSPLEAAPAINAKIIASCTNIVALAGAEQIQAALNTGADIVIAGRATDTAVIAALPLMRGCHAGGAWHGAKIGECGALATTHPNSGTILIEFDETGFEITPMAPEAAATPRTVSAHMLYENSDPYVLYEPGGYLDVRGASYEALDARRVRVTGSDWVPTAPYAVKLEGARIAGYQSMTLALIREARYVQNVHQWCAMIKDKFAGEVASKQAEVELRVIGANATLGALETQTALPHEVGVLAIVTAPDQATANEIAKMLNPALLHWPLTPDEPMPTFAFPFSPAEVDRGPIYEFCLHHVMRLDDPMAAFRLDVVEV